MSFSTLRAAVFSLSLALVACGSGAASDSSETLATVYGQPITLAELKAEAPGVETPEQRNLALSRMIDRKLLAKAAEDAKLDKDGLAKLEGARAVEVAMANARGRALTASRTAPSAAEVDSYIAAHPEAFANRRFLIVDQIELRGGDGVLAGMPAAKTLDELQAQLDAAKAPYQRTIAVVDTASAAPQIIARLLAVPASGVFAMEAADAKVFGRVLEVRSQPFSGPFARQVAENLIKNQALRDAVVKDVAALRKAAAGKIEYSEGYAAPAP